MSAHDRLWRRRRASLAGVALAGASMVAGCGGSDEVSTAESTVSPSTAPVTVGTTGVDTSSASSVVASLPETTASEVIDTTSPAIASDDGAVVMAAPTPFEMCPAGELPQVVAYAYDGTEVRWASCTDEVAYRGLLPVTDGVVYVGAFDGLIALDAETGEEIEDPPPPPPSGIDEPETQDGFTRVEVGDYVVTGGQDDPTSVLAVNGVAGWTQPGVWAYDDVWAIDDGAVFAVERATDTLVAYELDSGDTRWSYQGDSYGEGLWPWNAVDGRLYTLWFNLQVRATSDGALIWRTDYPVDEMSATGLHMTGVETDGSSVFVSFTTGSSGGD